MRIVPSKPLRTAAALFAAVLVPVALLAQPNSNGAAVPVPTLDGVGLATLGGVIAMGGSWLLMKRRGRK